VETERRSDAVIDLRGGKEEERATERDKLSPGSGKRFSPRRGYKSDI